MKKYALAIALFIILIFAVYSVSADSGATSSGSSGSGSLYKPGTAITLEKHSVSGKISLPNGEVAKEDILLKLYVKNSSKDQLKLMSEFSSGGPGVNIGGSSSTNVAVSQSKVEFIIPKGENCINYAFSQYVSSKYACVAGESDCKGYLLDFESDSFEVLGAKSENINIVLEKPDAYVSGAFVTEEDNKLPDEDMNVFITLTGDDGKRYKTSCVLKNGNDRANFSVPVKFGEYVLAYRADSCKMSMQHISDETITLENKISVSADVDNVILKCAYCDVIEGVISLPNGMYAPKGGVEIDIEGGRDATAFIPEGQNSINYAVCASDRLYVTANVKNNYDVHFEPVRMNRQNAEKITLEPMYTVFGKIIFSQPIDKNYVRISIFSNDKLYYDDISKVIYFDDNTKEIEYFMELPENTALGDAFDIKVYMNSSDKFLSTDLRINSAFTAEKYANVRDVNVDVTKKAELIKGKINLPGVSEELVIDVYFENANKHFSDTVTKIKDSYEAEFCITADGKNIDDWSGEYSLSFLMVGYSHYEMYYNGSEMLSLYDEKSKIKIDGKTAQVNLLVPDKNLTFNATFLTPESTDDTIDVNVYLMEKDSGIIVEKTKFTLNTEMKNHVSSLGFTAKKDTEYIIFYEVDDETNTYNNYLKLYITDNGYFDKKSGAKVFCTGSNVESITFDLSPITNTSSIELELEFASNAVVEEDNNTYFTTDVSIYHNNIMYTSTVYFYSGDRTNTYKLYIPDIYKDLSWKIFYMVDEKIRISEIPDDEKFNDSTFIAPYPNGNSSGGGNCRKFKVPKDIVWGICEYYAGDDSVAYNESDAKEFYVAKGENVKINAVLGNITSSYPRIVGGYFRDIGGKTDVVVQLCDIKGSCVFDSVELCSDNDWEFYSLKTTSPGAYVLRFLYDGKTFYYSENNTLTENFEDAEFIDFDNAAVKYGFDVNKDNIWCHDFYQRFLNYDIESFDYLCGDLKICIYDTNGNLLSKSENAFDKIFVNTDKVLLGFEFSGKQYYFTKKPVYHHRTNYLYDYSENLSEAYKYVLPHASVSADVTLDFSEFVCGKSVSKSGETIISKSYFDTEDDGDEISVKTIYIEASNMGDENFVIAVLYDSSGNFKKILFICRENYFEEQLNLTLKSGEYIKLMPWNKNLKPLGNSVTFFK